MMALLAVAPGSTLVVNITGGVLSVAVTVVVGWAVFIQWNWKASNRKIPRPTTSTTRDESSMGLVFTTICFSLPTKPSSMPTPGAPPAKGRGGYPPYSGYC